MMYRNKKTGKEVSEELALEYALDALGLAVMCAKPSFEEFSEWLVDYFYNLEEWEEIEEGDEDDDEGEVLDLDALRRQEYVDVIRERLCM